MTLKVKALRERVEFLEKRLDGVPDFTALKTEIDDLKNKYKMLNARAARGKDDE